MRHERFVRIAEPERIATAECQRRPALRTFAAWLGRRIARALVNDRPHLGDFSDAQLRDIGLTRNDIERF